MNRRGQLSLVLHFRFVMLIVVTCSSALCGPIHDAAGQSDPAKVEALVKENPDLVFSKDGDGGTPLHRAAFGGSKEVVELLLTHKPNPNARDSGDFTPLYWAADGGHKDIIELLLANKAGVNAKNNRSFLGATALHAAV